MERSPESTSQPNQKTIAPIARLLRRLRTQATRVVARRRLRRQRFGSCAALRRDRCLKQPTLSVVTKTENYMNDVVGTYSVAASRLRCNCVPWLSAPTFCRTRIRCARGRKVRTYLEFVDARLDRSPHVMSRVNWRIKLMRKRCQSST